MVVEFGGATVPAAFAVAATGFLSSVPPLCATAASDPKRTTGNIFFQSIFASLFSAYKVVGKLPSVFPNTSSVNGSCSTTERLSRRRQEQRGSAGKNGRNERDSVAVSIQLSTL